MTKEKYDEIRADINRRVDELVEKWKPPEKANIKMNYYEENLMRLIYSEGISRGISIAMEIVNNKIYEKKGEENE